MRRKPFRKTCSWWRGHGRDQVSCRNPATHEWKSSCSSGWSPRCDEHRVEPAKPGEMLAGGYRNVRPLPTERENREAE